NHEELQVHELHIVDAEAAQRREEIRTRAKAALSAFGVGSTTAAVDPAGVFARYERHFQSREERQEAARWCGEILLEWADAEAPADQPGNARFALRLLDLADRLFQAHNL